MTRESYIEIIKKLKKIGIGFTTKRNVVLGSTYLETVCIEMENLFKNYYLQLQDDDNDLDKALQQKIDMNICWALNYAKWIVTKKDITDEAKDFLNAVKFFFLNQMQKQNLFIIDSILFESKQNLGLLFQDSSSRETVNKYIEYCASSFKELQNKYNNGTISKQESILLMKILSSNYFFQKDKEFTDKVFSDIYIKENPTKYEIEFLIRYVARWKCQKNEIKYVKPYLYTNPTSTQGGSYSPSSHFIEINTGIPRSGREFTFDTLHEYEHYYQNLECLNGVLSVNSLAEMFWGVISSHFSNDKFDEYDENYRFTDIEVYANTAAKREDMLLFMQLRLFNLNRKLQVDRVVPKSIPRGIKELFVKGMKKTEDNQSYTINYYNVSQLEKALQDDESYISYYPILESFYDRHEKRMKNIQELSVEYAKQDAKGRDAFIPFVEYQIANNGLDLEKLDFDNLPDVDKLNVLFLVSRHFEDLFARIFLYINYSHTDVFISNKMYDEYIKIFAKELAFIRRNSEYIKSVEGVWLTNVSEQTLNSEFGTKHKKTNNSDVRTVYEKFGFDSIDSIGILSLYAGSDIPGIMAKHELKFSTEDFKLHGHRRKSLLQKLDQSLQTISIDENKKEKKIL